MREDFIEDRDELCGSRARGDRADPESCVRLHGQSCSASDSTEVRDAFERELKARGILFGREAKGKNPRGSIVLTEYASVGFCAIGAAVMVYPDGVWYAQVRSSDVNEIVEENIS